MTYSISLVMSTNKLYQNDLMAWQDYIKNSTNLPTHFLLQNASMLLVHPQVSLLFFSPFLWSDAEQTMKIKLTNTRLKQTNKIIFRAYFPLKSIIKHTLLSICKLPNISPDIIAYNNKPSNEKRVQNIISRTWTTRSKNLSRIMIFIPDFYEIYTSPKRADYKTT